MVFAKRSFGQNFLINQGAIAKIVDSLDLAAESPVLEIGPGRGALTNEIVAQGAQLTVIEVDPDMIAVIDEQHGQSGKVSIINADILSVDLSELLTPGSRIVGNLPYNISSPILRRLIDHSREFRSASLMLQREVVDRITARPGERERGFLTVLVEAAFHAERLFDLSPGSFRPQPKVWSSVVKLTPRAGGGIRCGAPDDVAPATER